MVYLRSLGVLTSTQSHTLDFRLCTTSTGSPPNHSSDHESGPPLGNFQEFLGIWLFQIPGWNSRKCWEILIFIYFHAFCVEDSRNFYSLYLNSDCKCRHMLDSWLWSGCVVRTNTGISWKVVESHIQIFEA